MAIHKYNLQSTMPTSLSRLTECISDFVISSGKEGASVSDVLSQFSSEPPRACRYIIEGLIRKGYRVCRPAGNETLGHAENIFESNSSLRIAAPRSLYYKSVGIVSHEDLQGDDFEKVLDIVAASREIGSLAMELGKGQGLARVERLVLVGLLRKRIVYPPVEGASTTLRAGVLHLQRFAGQFHPSVAGSSLEPDDNARAALVDCIHYVLERCHLSRINIFRLGSLFDLSPATIRSLRPMCGPCCKLQVSDDSRGNTFIDLNSGAVSRPVRESRGGGILSLSLFEQLLPAISNLSSVGLTVNEFCYQTGLGKKEAQSRFDNLIGMYTLSHSVDQSGTVHSQMRIIPDSRNVIASGGLIPSQSADKGAANVHIFKSEAHRNIPISDVDAIKAPVITLHEQRYDAVWNCIITNGGVCSLHDCFNAVREMYTRRGIAFVVDRKTVNRIIEQLSENGNIILHTVSETQALENLKTGAKLIIRRCDGVPLFSLDEAFAIYSSRRPSSDLEKRQFDAELVVIEAAESFGTETIPALNEYFPDIELVSKYR